MNLPLLAFNNLRTVLIYSTLGLLAYAAYSFPISLFFGINMSFGAAFVYLAASRYGWRAGLALLALVHGVLLIVQQSDWTLWSHTVEAAVIIGLHARFRRLSFIGAGAVYWLLAGIPIHAYLNAQTGGFGQETIFYTYAMAAGGLCNALLAELGAVYLPAILFRKGAPWSIPPLRIAQTLIHIMVAAMIGSSILFLVSGGQSLKQTVIRDINDNADKAALAIQSGMRAMTPSEQRGIRLHGYLEQALAQRMIDNVLVAEPYEAILVDHRGEQLLRIASDTPLMEEWLQVDGWRSYFAERRMWSPSAEQNEYAGSQWRDMSFVYPVKLGTSELYVRVPLDSYRNEVYIVYNAQMISCLYVTGIIALFAFVIHRLIGTGIRRLGIVTEGIPDKVKEGIAPEWPQSKMEEINLLIANFRTVTEKLGLMFMESREQAYFDMLTGLPNRRNFSEHLQRRIYEVGAVDDVHVVFMDLDRFKHINDTLGHAVGDLLLQQVAYRLSQAVGDRAFVARLGGDEFVLVSERDREDVQKVAEELLAALEMPFVIGNEELFVTASMGISSLRISGDDLDTIVKHADFAMYEAKAVGGNDYRFYSQPDTDLSKRMRLEFELRKAVDREQLRLHYMPIFDKERNRLVSIEALLRWQHPEFGHVLPAMFIPIAESCGLLKPIGEWVAREACRQMMAWRAQGIEPVPVAINLSPTQIQLYGIVEYLEQVLKETGMPPELLEVEITEEVFAKHPERVITELHRLKKQGVKVWIDDFGTGYSSLGLLNRMPVDGFKIDRTFVKDIHEDTDKLSIIETMMLLSRSRNWLVVAEGVETIGESTALEEAGCSLQQGYYFGQAVPASQIAEWFPRRIRIVGSPSAIDRNGGSMQ